MNTSTLVLTGSASRPTSGKRSIMPRCVRLTRRAVFAFQVVIDPERVTAQFSAPSFKGDKRWYWHYNSGIQPQSGTYDDASLRRTLIPSH